jgi:hypothetical protein
MKDKLFEVKLRNLLLKYSLSVENLNEVYLKGKYIWEVDLPSVITIGPTTDFLPDKANSHSYSDLHFNTTYVFLKTSIVSREDGSFFISAYEVDLDKYKNKSFTHKNSFYMSKDTYGKTWWVLKYNHKQKIENLFKEMIYL